MEAQQPPPASPAPGRLEVGEAISYGWNAFKKYPGPLILIVVVIWAVNLVIGFVGQALNDTFVLWLAVQIIGWLISILLFMGLLRVALKVTRGEQPEVADLFQTDHFGPYLVASVLFSIGLAIGLFFLIVPGIIFAVVFGFFGYAILDHGDDIGGAFSRSADITKGQRGTVFLLGLAIFGINLLGAILCGVGLLVSYPVTIVAGGYAYRTLSGEPVAPIPA